MVLFGNENFLYLPALKRMVKRIIAQRAAFVYAK